MDTLLVIIGAVLVFALLYLFATRGRKGHEGLAALKGHRYAHRGLHSAGVPENSRAAFREAVRLGLGSELDVHLLDDGGLAVIHDSKLIRTTGAAGRVEDLTVSQLEDYCLEGTQETIPTLAQVLEIYGGKYPLIIELKTVGGNHAALCQRVLDELEGYRGAYCLESFDPRVVYWLRKHRPEIIRGQLTESFYRSKPKVLCAISWMMASQVLNFLTRPDFVAYRYEDRRGISNFLARRVWGMAGASWTIRSKEDLETAEKEGWIPIFENFIP